MGSLFSENRWRYRDAVQGTRLPLQINKSHGAIPGSGHYRPDGSNAKLGMGQNDPREGSSVKSLLPRFPGTREEQLCAAHEQTRFFTNADGWSLAEAMLGRQPTTTIRRMVPLPEPRDVQPEPEGARGDPLTQAKTFQIHEPVWIRSFKGKKHLRWVFAITVRTVGGRL